MSTYIRQIIKASKLSKPQSCPFKPIPASRIIALLMIAQDDANKLPMIIPNSEQIIRNLITDKLVRRDISEFNEQLTSSPPRLTSKGREMILNLWRNYDQTKPKWGDADFHSIF